MKQTWLVCALLVGCVGQPHSPHQSGAIGGHQRITPATPPYDSTRNFLGPQVQQYLGQVLRVRPLPARTRPYGYRRFYAHLPTSSLDLGAVYAHSTEPPRTTSPADALEGRVFQVVDIVRSARAAEPTHVRDITYLVLRDQHTDEVLFFAYSPRYAHAFPFLVQGYVDKLAATHTNRRFLLRRLDSLNAAATTPHTWRMGDTLTCTGFIIEPTTGRLAADLRRADSAQLLVSPDQLVNRHYFFSEAYARTLATQFDPETLDRIIRGDLVAGMSSKACRLAWGPPDNINRLVDSSGTTEQWGYGNQRYLYFHNDLLEAVEAQD